MKIKGNLFALTLITSVAFFSCKKEDHISPANTSSVISEGNWKVISYVDNGKDETNHFSDYSFQFMNGGKLSATKNNANSDGSWSTGKDDSQTKIAIGFPSAPLNELNEDWHVIKQSATSLELEHVSGGNGGTESVHFQRN